MDVLKDGSSSKDGKVRQIVAGAENNRTGDQAAVVMDAAKIVTVTGVSRRYAYDLIEDLPKQHHWILTRSEARERNSRCAAKVRKQSLSFESTARKTTSR